MHWKPTWISRRWMLAGMLLAVMLALRPTVGAQVTTTPVVDTIYRADGSPAAGTVVISWPEFSTAAGQSVSGGSISTTISAGGALNVQLAPNAGSNPMGSYYTVIYHLNDGSVSREYWVVPASATAVKVSAIRSTVMPLSVAQNTVSKSYVDQAIANAVGGGGGGTIPQDGSGYVRTTGDTMTGALNLPADPTLPNNAADKHYVDLSVQQVASGVGQKVSLVPQGTQVVAQPTGSELNVNVLNGEEYATQYVNGLGNNGVLNAVNSADCANGCEVKVGKDYNSAESYVAAAWKNGTHVEDARLGGTIDTYSNPSNPLFSGLASGRTIDLVATKNPGLSNGVVVSQTPNDVALNITMEALTGGSNLFPASIEPSVPYFKSNYIAEDVRGTFNTMGQHVLTSDYISCYGVGDCLIGAHSITASGGFRDEADEGAHPFDLSYQEDTQVYQGNCSTGCGTGSTSIGVGTTSGAGTQGEGRFLIDKSPSKVISAGSLIGGAGGAPYPTANFTGTSFPVSVFFTLAQGAVSQANNIAPGAVTLSIQTANLTPGFATNTSAAPAGSGVACVVDQNPSGTVLPHNYEMANYTVVDGTHFRLTLNKVHAAGTTVAIGGLCGYGLEQTVDTVAGIRQVFPVVGSLSPTTLYYAGGVTAIVGISNETGGYLNVSSAIASVARSGNVVTLTASGNFPQDINGLNMTVSGVGDGSYNGTFTVTTTSANTLTYSQSGPNSSSAGGNISYLTGGYALYPMAEVLGVLNAATKVVDGQMALAPNTVAWAAGDPVEQPHYYQERIAADTEAVTQYVPRPTTAQQAGIYFNGTNAQGLIGWQIVNTAPASSYFGAGGTHSAPTAAFVAGGVWQSTMRMDAGQQAVFNINCNYRGCGQWNSTYDLFDLQSNAGVDTVRYQPQASVLDIGLRGATYEFNPQAFNAGTINVNTLNATTINGQVNGNSITSGSVAPAYLPMLGASGTAHKPGIVPDPGPLSGASRFLREDGTWSVPSGSGATSTLLPGATADYNFLQGSGTILADSTGSGNSGTLVSSAAPSWTATGLSFLPGQGVSLPAALNGTQTFFAGVYINPITAGNQLGNQYPVLISSSNGGGGFNFMYNYVAGGGFIPNAYAPTFFVNNAVGTAAPNLISGFHVLAAVLSGSGGKDRLYIDGAEVAAYTSQGSSAGAQSSGNLFLGSSNVGPWQGSGLNGTLYRVRTYPTALTASSVQAVSAAIMNEVGTRGVATTPVPTQLAATQLHAIGDSITYGFNTSTPWPSLLTLTNQPAYTITDWGITGITLAAIDGSEPNRAALQCHSSAGAGLALIMAGTNDFSLLNVPASNVLQSLLGEVQTMKTAGCRVFVGTMISRTGNDPGGRTLDSDKNAYNSLILSQARAGGADGVIDFAANPLMGADGANTNATYFQPDHVHPTQAGQALLAAAASNALNYVYGANEASPHVVTTLGYQMTAADGYISLSGLSGPGTLTLPDCTGQSGAAYRINNPQSAYVVSVVPLNAGQPINGLSMVGVPANSTVTLRDVPNPRNVSGCHWEM